MTDETQQPDPGDGTLDGEPLADVPDAGGNGEQSEGELGDDELGGAGPA